MYIWFKSNMKSNFKKKNNNNFIKLKINKYIFTGKKLYIVLSHAFAFSTNSSPQTIKSYNCLSDTDMHFTLLTSRLEQLPMSGSRHGNGIIMWMVFFYALRMSARGKANVCDTYSGNDMQIGLQLTTLILMYDWNCENWQVVIAELL